MEKLIELYQKTKSGRFQSSVAKVLEAEEQDERLMNYVEKHLTIDVLEEYHACFSKSFPEKTLSLLRKVMDEYAQATGRDVYERILALFRKMQKIEGGNDVVKEMINHYRTIYRNRKAMMEIINRIQY